MSTRVRNSLQASRRDSAGPLLEVENLRTSFETALGVVRAVDGVSFTLARGRSLGIVGESGSGKTILSRSIMGLLPRRNVIREGSVRFEGMELTTMSLRQRRNIWGAEMAMIFQDPMTSLNPVMKVGKQIAEPLRTHLDMSRSDATATSMRLLEDLTHRYGLTLMFIAHDLAVVKNVSDRVGVMYLGKLCEVAGADRLYARPAHPYTDILLKSIPVPDPTVRPDPNSRIDGEIPSPVFPPSGCRFRTRCPRAQDRCALEEPIVRAIEPDHYVACHFPLIGETAPPVASNGATRGSSLPTPGPSGHPG